MGLEWSPLVLCPVAPKASESHEIDGVLLEVQFQLTNLHQSIPGSYPSPQSPSLRAVAKMFCKWGSKGPNFRLYFLMKLAGSDADRSQLIFPALALRYFIPAFPYLMSWVSNLTHHTWSWVMGLSISTYDRCFGKIMMESPVIYVQA